MHHSIKLVREGSHAAKSWLTPPLEGYFLGVGEGECIKHLALHVRLLESFRAILTCKGNFSFLRLFEITSKTGIEIKVKCQFSGLFCDLGVIQLLKVTS